MHPADITTEYKPLRITNTGFKDNQSIPAKYTCEGIDINPPIDIDGIPEKAHSLALIVDDPDAPENHGCIGCCVILRSHIISKKTVCLVNKG